MYAIPTIDNPTGLANCNVIENTSSGWTSSRAIRSRCVALSRPLATILKLSTRYSSLSTWGRRTSKPPQDRAASSSPLITTGAVTGNEVDRMIANDVEEETQGRVNIDHQTAREYKEEHADFDNFEPFTDIIQQPGGGSHEFTIEFSVMER